MQVRRSRQLALQSFLAMALCGAVWAQARRVTPPQAVASFDELRPKTPDQMARAKLWNVLGGRRLTEGESRKFRPGVQGMEPIFLPQPADKDDPFSFRHRICLSSTVVFGTISSAQTFLNADETALFTDFQLAVDQRIRPSSAESTVLVSRGGGRALVGGKTLLEVYDDEFLEVGQRYALFLRWAPEFKAHLPDSYLPIAGGVVLMPDGQLKPEPAFLAQLKAFATKCKEPRAP